MWPTCKYFCVSMLLVVCRDVVDRVVHRTTGSLTLLSWADCLHLLLTPLYFKHVRGSEAFSNNGSSGVIRLRNATVFKTKSLSGHYFGPSTRGLVHQEAAAFWIIICLNSAQPPLRQKRVPCAFGTGTSVQLWRSKTLGSSNVDGMSLCMPARVPNLHRLSQLGSN